MITNHREMETRHTREIQAGNTVIWIAVTIKIKSADRRICLRTRVNIFLGYHSAILHRSKQCVVEARYCGENESKIKNISVM